MNVHGISKIFEPGSGHGVFYDIAQNKNNLFSSHGSKFNYIMNEINPEYETLLSNLVKSNHKDNVQVLIENVLNIDMGENKTLIWFGESSFNTNHRKFVPG